MEQETFFKSVEFTKSQSAVIKSKWSQAEDELEVSIFVKESSAVYIGKNSIESLKKKDPNADFELVKRSITAIETIDDINYELDLKRKRFIVVKHEVGDSQDSIGDIILLRIDLMKLEPAEAFPAVLQLASDALQIQKLLFNQKTEVEKCKKDFNDSLRRLDALEAEKVDFDQKVYPSFLSLLNSKKDRIAELERKVQRLRNGNSKFANLSSDLDASDLSLQEAKPTNKSPVKQSTPLKKTLTERRTSKTSDDNVSKPSSTSSYRSPVKVSPRKSLRRTPSGSLMFQKKTLFSFKGISDSDDSDATEKSKPRSPRTPKSQKVLFKNSDILSGLSVKLKPKLPADDGSRSSSDLMVSKEIDKSKDESTSSKSSYRSCGKSTSPEHVEPAQRMDLDATILESSQPENQNTEDIFDSSDHIFTQRLEEEEIPNSQSSDSPSIFRTFPKRKHISSSLSCSSKKTKLTMNKSKFSIDTIDILAQDSQ